MKFKNARQLKDLVKNKAAEMENTTVEAIRQNVMMEHFIRRLSVSKYKDTFIIKGGVLVSSMVGLNNRATMDLDTTIKNFFLSSSNIKNALEDICSVDLGDGFSFAIEKIDSILEENTYPGLRVHMKAFFDKTWQPLKIDVTTADVITPHEVDYEIASLFDDPIKVKAYPLETILAEKLETILARDISNTRMRDFYDIGALCDIKGQDIDYGTLFLALRRTAEKRGSVKLLNEYDSILETVKNNEEMQKLWSNYANNYRYARKYRFEDLCDKAKDVLEELFRIKREQPIEDLISNAAEQKEKKAGDISSRDLNKEEPARG